jgi:hypothetical protein
MNRLDDSNFMLYAAQNYINPGCADVLEFHEDLSRVKYIKRLFRRYSETVELKERLILNHLIVLYNVFDTKALTRMLVYKLYDYLEYLKPFLIFLSYWPSRVENIGLHDEIILDSDVALDNHIANTLRKI